MNIRNNTILITGGGSGIGLALAKELARHKNKIIICGRDLQKLESAKAEIPGAEILRCDISDENSVTETAEYLKHNHPAFNFLINNAGVMGMWNIKQGGLDIINQKKEILTNLWGTIQLTQLLIPHLLTQPNAYILTVSSALAFAPISVAPIYSATKAALHSYNLSLRQQLKGTSIGVFELLPGEVKTEMSANIKKKIQTDTNDRALSPEKLAMLTIQALKDDRYEIRPGMANALYNLSRFFPAFLQKMLEKQSDKILAHL